MKSNMYILLGENMKFLENYYNIIMRKKNMTRKKRKLDSRYDVDTILDMSEIELQNLALTQQSASHHPL